MMLSMLSSARSLLGNARISAKVCAVPLLIMCFMLGLGTVSHIGANRQSAALDRVANVAFAKDRLTAEAARAAEGAHMDLYRVISWQANSTYADKVKESAKQVGEDLAAAAAILGKLASAYVLDEHERAAIHDVDEALKAYQVSAQNVLEMTATDASMGLTFTLYAENKFSDLEARLAALRGLEKDLAEATAATATRSAATTTRVSILLLVCALALAGSATFLSSRMIARPILRMTQAMMALANGDRNVSVPDSGRKDEIGHMADALLVFKEGMARADALAAEQERERAAKDARARRLEIGAQAFDQGIHSIIKAVSAATNELESSAKAMTSSTEQTTRQSAAVTAAAGQASANVQTVASAAEELTASIAEIGRRVARSGKIAQQAVADAERTNATVKVLADAAHRIGDVVKLISDIASQTNLLALNATIEAARAGDAGKGFAVVASEVKSLATQTAKATEEIAAQVEAIQGSTRNSVAAIAGIGTTIREVNDIASEIDVAVTQQSGATQEIARNALEASGGTNQVSVSIATVASAADESGRAADRVLMAAQDVAAQTDSLRAEVEKFLLEVRAA